MTATDPGYATSALADIVYTHFGARVQHARFLPHGYTSNCYAVIADDGKYLLKLWHAEPDSVPLTLTESLHDAGLPVPPPMRTRDGELFARTHLGPAGLYPYVEGTSPGWDAWSPTTLHRLGEILAGVHRFGVPPGIRRDDLAIPDEDSIARETGEIRTQLERLRGLRAAVLEQSWVPVLCHTDIGGDNLLVQADAVTVLDWDEVTIGPPENDWVLLARDHPVRGAQFERVLDGYRAAGGVLDLDPTRLAFCMLRRYVGDGYLRLLSGDAKGYRRWGVRQWEQLNRVIDRLRPILGRG